MNALPLTVWVGSMRYVFAPDRNVIVGYGERCDIRLDRLGPIDPNAVPNLVLRFNGTHWVAIDRSNNGIFVDGARMSTVDIRNGQSIAIGDPARGPRLTFQLAAPVGPGEAATKQMRVPQRPQPPLERATRPMPLPQSAPAAPAEDAPPKSRGLVDWMAIATKQLHIGRPGTGAGEPAPPTTSRLPLKPGARTIGVAAYELGLTTGGHDLLSSVSFTARPGSLVAVIGPSPARNSALVGLLGGTRPLSSGVLTVDGHDVHAEPESTRSRIGVIARDDRVHAGLTVEQAVGYAAEMRLPPNTSPDDRHRVINQVLDELELTPHRKTRVARLPPEMRRCASMAIELVTRPSLLVVDEPSAGLTPAQEHHVMALLRRQADLGCVVVAATASLSQLNLCDQVLLLTPAGTLAYAGPPAQIESAMGTSNWADIFAQISTHPVGAHRAFLTRQQASVSTTPPAVAAPDRAPAELTFWQQIRLVTRRQARLLVAHRGYFVVLLLLPFAMGALALLIPGSSGWAKANPSGKNPHEAVEILALLNIGAVLMGTALTIRDLVGERRIFRREHSVGLSTSAYLAGKIIVFSVAAAVQAAILTAIVVVVKGRPVQGAVLLHDPALELYVAVTTTTIVSAIVGLALSLLGNSLREVLPLVVPVILASLLFAGGLVSLVGTWGYDQISWLVPAQWGFAATASTVDLRRVDTLAAHNQVWTHYVGWWMFDMFVLIVFGAMCAAFVRYRLGQTATSRTTGTA
ncbi:ATP-binding cassette domain-containing protein [Mycobacterium riyadhense]|uniref:ATP-binding cassette domain-containing protein n=1 Tax=Mycobacterium riyadhense TaxID=486698 RepID=UPI001EF9D0B6|nr:ATP-binding cassette domain-containing protein [Mycobacterium riyadhense]